MDVLAYFKQRCELDRSINLRYAKVRQYADNKPRYPKETTDFVDDNAFNTKIGREHDRSLHHRWKDDKG